MSWLMAVLLAVLLVAAYRAFKALGVAICRQAYMLGYLAGVTELSKAINDGLAKARNHRGDKP